MFADTFAELAADSTPDDDLTQLLNIFDRYCPIKEEDKGQNTHAHSLAQTQQTSVVSESREMLISLSFLCGCVVCLCCQMRLALVP